jgi:hypothetical protein
MGDEGEPAVDDAICPRDGGATRLRCTDCQKPICPRCFVRTPVGLKCQECAAPVPAAMALSGWSRPGRGRLATAAAVAVVVVAVGAWALLGRSGGAGPASDSEVGVTARSTAVPGAVAGTGRALDGRSWALEARRDDRGRVCSRLKLTSGTSSPESCDTPPGQRPFGPVRPRGVFGAGQPTFQSWGILSDRVVRVRANAEDGTTTDADVFGGDLGLGVKFFMSYADRLHAVTFVAYGADGEELGRSDPPPISPPPGR